MPCTHSFVGAQKTTRRTSKAQTLFFKNAGFYQIDCRLERLIYKIVDF